MQRVQTKLVQIFKIQRVMTIQTLKKHLNNRSSRSIFRYLATEGYFSSFTHAGKYYTLKNIPQFNSDGFWFYNDIGFTKYGTLKNIIIKLIDNSQVGETHDQLKKKLHIRVQNTLLDLVQTNKIIRNKINGDYVYLSADVSKSKKQISNRELSLKKREEAGYPDWIIIEILASIIRISQGIEIDPLKIVSELRERKILITVDEVEQVLNKLNLKKTLDLR